MTSHPVSPEGYDRIKENLFETSDATTPRDSPAPPPKDIRPRLGKYVVTRMIAQGGMGIVFEAEDPELRRRVALKVLKDGEENSKEVMRLHREAEIAAQLHHPNIIGIHEVAMVRDEAGFTRHFIAMDYVEGATMYELMQGERASRPELLRMLEEVARAVDYAHSKGVVHRDLKPSNVLVEPGGRVLLTDFGIARAENFTRLTKSQSVMGTPQYMPPEQVEGRLRDIGPRTDVYALGAMLYEILTGRPPFLAPTPAKIYEQILRDDPVPPRRRRPSVEPELEVICLKALEKSPARRYATAVEFAEELRRVRAGEPIRATPVSTWRRLARKAGRNRPILVVVTALIVAVLGGTSWGIVSTLQHRRRLAAEREFRERREEGLRWLSSLWSAILERKRELRLLRVPPDHGRRELKEAVAQVDGHIREWPEEPAGYYVRARGRMYLADFAEAEKDLTTAVTKRPDFRPGWSLLGMTKIEEAALRTPLTSESTRAQLQEWEQRLREAETFLRQGLESEREIEELRRWGLPWTREDEVMHRKAQALALMYLQRKKDEAIRLLERSMETYQSEEYANLLGNWAASAEENVRQQTQAITWAPGYARAYFERGCAKIELEDFRGAIQDFDRTIVLQENFFECYVNRSHAKERSGDCAGAISDLDLAIQIRADSAHAYNKRGIYKCIQKDFDGAISDLNRAIEIRPDDSKAYVNRGNARQGKGDWAGSIADYDRAIQMDPESPTGYMNRANSRVALKEYGAAIADLEATLRAAPANWPHRKRIERLLQDTRSKLGKE